MQKKTLYVISIYVLIKAINTPHFEITSHVTLLLTQCPQSPQPANKCLHLCIKIKWKADMAEMEESVMLSELQAKLTSELGKEIKSRKAAKYGYKSND